MLYIAAISGQWLNVDSIRSDEKGIFFRKGQRGNRFSRKQSGEICAF